MIAKFETAAAWHAAIAAAVHAGLTFTAYECPDELYRYQIEYTGGF